MGAATDRVNALGHELYDQANRYSQTGATVPRDVLSAAAMAVSAGTGYDSETLTVLEQRVGDYLELMRALALAPNLAGYAEVIDGPDLVAGREVDFDMVYRPGVELGVGAELILGSLSAPGITFQHIDGDGRDFVSVSSAGARFEVTAVTETAIAGGGEGPGTWPVFRLAEGTVGPDSEVRFNFRRFTLPERSSASLSLPFRIRTAAGQSAVPVPIARRPVVPGPVARLELAAPYEAAPDRPVTILVRLTDTFGNLASGVFPPLDILVDGEFRTRIERGEDPAPLFELSLTRLGTHEIEVRSAGGGLSTSAFVRTTSNPRTIRWLEPQAQPTGGVQEHLLGIVDTYWTPLRDDRVADIDWRARSLAGADGFLRAGNLRAGGHWLVLSQTPLRFSPAPRRQFPDIRSLDRFDGDLLFAALPDVPYDLRLRDHRRMNLVAIQTGSGSFEWYGRRFAEMGLRTGFIGSSESLAADRHSESGRTAVQLRAGESAWDGLAAGRTWVTSGPRIHLDVSVNGAAPGSRTAASAEREIDVQVTGTAPIERIDLVRNGEVIGSRDINFDADGRILRLWLSSSTEPLNGVHDLPRNGREWIGYLRLRGGRLGQVGKRWGTDSGHLAAINPADPGRMDFITWTRGRARSFEVEIDAVEDDAYLEVVLSGGREAADQLPLTRPPAAIPSTTMVITLQELKSGVVSRQYDVAGYQDQVGVKLVTESDVPVRVNHRFSDRRKPGDVDYYYVRAIQVDDHVAWSSPVFVGGFDPD